MGKSWVIATNSLEFANSMIQKIKTSLNIEENDNFDNLNIFPEEKRNSIGIKQMETLKNWSKTKPYRGLNKLATIFQAELLTTEAQNSILKTLEEPNLTTNYILISFNYLQLLPTILSRCELVLDSSDKIENFDLAEFLNLDQLDKFKFLERFEKIEDIALRTQQIELFLTALIKHFQQELLFTAVNKKENAKPKNLLTKHLLIQNLKTIQMVFKMCLENVSSKNALDYLIINTKFA